MAEGDPLRILLAFDRWATGQILDASAKLPADQFYQRFDIGPGSLHDAITHMIAAMRAWTESLAGQEASPRIDTDGQRRTPEVLRALHEEASSAFAAEAGRRPMAEVVVRRLRDGRTMQATRGAAFAQVTTHGMHHRAQFLNMLRQLGVKPLPPSSVAEWTMMGEPRG